jgi:hypothetical protein
MEAPVSDPLLRISYLQAKQVTWLAGNLALLERYAGGVLLSSDDVRTLHFVSDRNITVRLECSGYRAYHGHVQQMLRYLIRVPMTEYWYLPVTLIEPARMSRSED